MNAEKRDAQKRDRMAAALCTRVVMAACSDADVLAAASSAVTNRKPGYWALTTVRPVRGVDPADLFNALAKSDRVPAADAKIEASLLGRTIKVWWKAK